MKASGGPFSRAVDQLTLTYSPVEAQPRVKLPRLEQRDILRQSRSALLSSQSALLSKLEALSFSSNMLAVPDSLDAAYIASPKSPFISVRMSCCKVETGFVVDTFLVAC